MLSPMVFLKLFGVSQRVIWRELGLESTIKSIEYHQKRGQEPPEKLAEQFISALPVSFQAALRTSRVQGKELQENGAVEPGELWQPWATFFLGRFPDIPPSEYPYASQYLLALERALVRPSMLLQQERYVEAVSAMSCSPVLRDFMSPEVTAAMRAVTSPKRLVFVQWAIHIEVALSYIAAWGAFLPEKGRSELQHDLQLLVAGKSAEDCTPLQVFFGLLLRDASVASQAEFVDLLNQHGVQVELRTLQRWSAGKTVPEEAYVRLIAKMLRPDNTDHILDLYDVARHLTFLGYVTETLLRRIQPHLETPGAASVFAPWPTFPFKCVSFTDWLKRRYPVWFDYHRNLIASGVSPLDLERRMQSS
ncbi:hypothetical protein [Denitromonas sp.]|uniref:hypothetical protein n=1 Tax=Denitromonas sp. TaxID=2734609 RepID=UPI002AFE27E5|nr:hypothetical protein [Denitromonas sp.]